MSPYWHSYVDNEQGRAAEIDLRASSTSVENNLTVGLLDLRSSSASTARRLAGFAAMRRLTTSASVSRDARVKRRAQSRIEVCARPLEAEGFFCTLVLFSRNCELTNGQMSMAQELLTTDELSARIKYDVRTIRERLKDSVLIEGVHYIRPFGGRKILSRMGLHRTRHWESVACPTHRNCNGERERDQWVACAFIRKKALCSSTSDIRESAAANTLPFFEQRDQHNAITASSGKA